MWERMERGKGQRQGGRKDEIKDIVQNEAGKKVEETEGRTGEGK